MEHPKVEHTIQRAVELAGQIRLGYNFLRPAVVWW